MKSFLYLVGGWMLSSSCASLLACSSPSDESSASLPSTPLESPSAPPAAEANTATGNAPPAVTNPSPDEGTPPASVTALMGQAGSGAGSTRPDPPANPSPAPPPPPSAPPSPSVPLAAFAYVGGYNNQISVFSMDEATGALTPRGAPADANPSPSFIAFAPDGKYLFSVNEADNLNGTNAGAVSAFRIDAATGGLTFINRVSSQGNGPAHVAVDHSGKFVFVANYNGGTIAVLPVADDGTLGDAVATDAHGANAQAHEAVIDATNQFLFTPNKGLSNISQYRFDATSGQLTPNTPPAVALAAGAGTRHLAFHPTEPFAYAINEVDDTMVTLAFNIAQGTLTPIQTLSTLPQGVDGGNNACAEVQVAPSGNFVYGTNRGNDTIVIYAVSSQTGMLSLVGHQATGGANPRSFHVDVNGKLLLVANQNTNQVVTFAVDTATGLLTQRSSVNVQAPTFVGVLYLPAQ
jgi:6-phosphogluconolactonase